MVLDAPIPWTWFEHTLDGLGAPLHVVDDLIAPLDLLEPIDPIDRVVDASFDDASVRTLIDAFDDGLDALDGLDGLDGLDVVISSAAAANLLPAAVADDVTGDSASTAGLPLHHLMARAIDDTFDELMGDTGHLDDPIQPPEAEAVGVSEIHEIHEMHEIHEAIGLDADEFDADEFDADEFDRSQQTGDTGDTDPFDPFDIAT